MPTVNEELQRRNIRHQIFTLRLAGGMANRLISVLDNAEKDIIRKIKAAAPTDAEWTKTLLNKTLKELQIINKKIYERAGAKLTSELVELSKYEAEFTEKMFSDVFPDSVPISINVPAASLLEGIVKTDPIAGKLLKEWIKDLSDRKNDLIRSQLRIGLVEGESINDLVKRIRGTRALGYKDGIMELGRRQAQAFVRTAVNNVSNRARAELYKQNKKIIKGEKWLATLDGRTTLICASRDGEVYPVGEGPRPPAHIGCRSTTTPVTKSFKELGLDLPEPKGLRRSALNGDVPANTNYDRWLRGESKTLQNDYLGKTKGKLFRDGKLPIDRFVDETGREYTIAELRVRESSAFTKAGI